MRARLYRKPDTGDVRVVVYARDAQLFVFRYGVALRVRIGQDWQHFALRLEGRRFDVGPGFGYGSVRLETWRTSQGVHTRVPLSKKYVALKVLG